MAGNPSCGMNYFCIGACLIFVGSILLCALGFAIILPHVATRQWPEVTCQVTNASYNFLHCTCDQQISAEDLGCVTKYPCLDISVQYPILQSRLSNLTGLNFVKYDVVHDVTDSSSHLATVQLKKQTATDRDRPTSDKDASTLSEHEGTSGDHKQVSNVNDVDKTQEYSSDSVATVVGYIHREKDTAEVDSLSGSTQPYTGRGYSSETSDTSQEVTNATQEDWILVSTTLFRGWMDAFYGKCALHECGVEEWNIKQADSFKKTWGIIGKTFPCFYHPDSPGVVILAKTPKSNVMHAILWPCLCLGGGSLLWLGLCVGCCSVGHESIPSS